jgi:hypothetical protein
MESSETLMARKLMLDKTLTKWWHLPGNSRRLDSRLQILACAPVMCAHKRLRRKHLGASFIFGQGHADSDFNDTYASLAPARMRRTKEFWREVPPTLSLPDAAGHAPGGHLHALRTLFVVGQRLPRSGFVNSACTFARFMAPDAHDPDHG